MERENLELCPFFYLHKARGLVSSLHAQDHRSRLHSSAVKGPPPKKQLTFLLACVTELCFVVTVETDVTQLTVIDKEVTIKVIKSVNIWSLN